MICFWKVLLTGHSRLVGRERFFGNKYGKSQLIQQFLPRNCTFLLAKCKRFFFTSWLKWLDYDTISVYRSSFSTQSTSIIPQVSTKKTVIISFPDDFNVFAFFRAGPPAETHCFDCRLVSRMWCYHVLPIFMYQSKISSALCRKSTETAIQSSTRLSEQTRHPFFRYF